MINKYKPKYLCSMLQFGTMTTLHVTNMVNSYNTTSKCFKILTDSVKD